MEEKLEAFVDGKMTEEEFEQDLEADAEVEGDKVTGMEEVKETGWMVALAMEVDADGESEVMAVEKGQRSGGQKRVLLSPPKQLRKRAHTATVMQMTTGSQVKMDSTRHIGIGCEWCVQQSIMCVAVDGGTRCANCKAKHYGCLLVVAKEVLRGKGGPSGLQQARVVVGSQMRAKVRRGKGAKGAALRGVTLGKWQ